MIIVVKAVLGNVNHALLTATYAQMHGLKVLGFIVNSWDEQAVGVLEESNLYYYEKLTGLPILGKLPCFRPNCWTALTAGTNAEIAEAHIVSVKY